MKIFALVLMGALVPTMASASADLAESILWLPQDMQKFMPALKEGAQRVASTRECVKLSSASVSTTDPRYTKANPVFFFNCRRPNGSYYQVRMTYLQIMAKSAPVEAKPVEKHMALGKCLNAIERKVAYVKPNGFETSYNTSPQTGNVEVRIGFVAPNSAGVKVHHTGKCILTPYGSLGVQILTP